MRMSITVNIPQFLQPSSDEVPLARVDGGTVGECLNNLVQKFPRLKPQLFSQNGKLHGYLDVFVNRESAYPEELARTVADGDELHIVNIIVGG
ncbi:MAG: MoaD/ThiS family protein [Chloroflexi bacterium]|nr:MoaD/ThiS family protein [Chloroflexota bacterium]